MENFIYIDQHQISTITEELKVLENNMYDDLKSLSHDIHDLGAGSIPDNEKPIKRFLISRNIVDS